MVLDSFILANESHDLASLSFCSASSGRTHYWLILEVVELEARDQNMSKIIYQNLLVLKERDDVVSGRCPDGHCLNGYRSAHLLSLGALPCVVLRKPIMAHSTYYALRNLINR